MTRYRDDLSPADQARLLAECAALDAAYARSTDDELQPGEWLQVLPDADLEDAVDEMVELRKAALSRGSTMSTPFEVVANTRDALSRTASAGLIRLALCRQRALDLDYLASAVLSLCHVIERQSEQIRALEEQCAHAHSDLRRATREGRR